MKHAFNAYISLEPRTVRILRRADGKAGEPIVPELCIPGWLITAIAGVPAPKAHQKIEEYATWMKRKNPHGQRFADKLLELAQPLAALNDDVFVMVQMA